MYCHDYMWSGFVSGNDLQLQCTVVWVCVRQWHTAAMYCHGWMWSGFVSDNDLQLQCTVMTACGLDLCPTMTYNCNVLSWLHVVWACVRQWPTVAMYCHDCMWSVFVSDNDNLQLQCTAMTVCGLGWCQTRAFYMYILLLWLLCGLLLLAPM